MQILKPKVIGSNPKVPDLLKSYYEKTITLDELSDAFNTKVQWEYRGVENSNPNWSATNTWATVHDALGGFLSQDDYMVIAQNYEDYQEKVTAND